MRTYHSHRVSVFVSLIAIMWTAFQIYAIVFTSMIPMALGAIHLAFASVLAFLLYPFSKRSSKDRITIPDWILAFLSIVCFGYFGVMQDKISSHVPHITPLTHFEIVICIIAIILILDATRRIIGWTLVVFALMALAYAYFGNYIQGILGHKGYSLYKIVDFSFFSYEGVWGTPVMVSATYLYMFVFFANVIRMSGLGDFFMDMSKSLCGRIRGGPAQIAVISSGLFGTISGSAAANVYATGSFTIPMMKKLGFPATTAGAIEAYASTGGMLMPPVMGSAAFIMAEYLGITYLSVCKMAMIPAILYYLCGNISVYLEARKLNLESMPTEEIPSFKKTLIEKGHLVISVIILVILLIKGYSAMRAVTAGILVAFLLSLIKKATRMGPKEVVKTFEETGKNAVIIAVSCGAVGIILGAFVLTGIGSAFSSGILKLCYGIPWLGVVIVALACFIMGLGLPTAPAYIMVATVGVPALARLGFNTEASHLFVLYYSVLGMITPPDAISAYAAASISGGDPMKTGWKACAIGLGSFVIPFVFIYDQSLLLRGELIGLIRPIVTALLGVTCISIAMSGWFFRERSYFERGVISIAAILLLSPNIFTDILGVLILGIIFHKEIYTLFHRVAPKLARRI